jgi:hypothetical protein
MEIEANRVYEHETYGEVLVMSVHEVYSSYDTDVDDGDVDGVFVRYSTTWDSHGPMIASVRNEPVDEFAPGVVSRGERVEFETL